MHRAVQAVTAIGQLHFCRGVQCPLWVIFDRGCVWTAPSWQELSSRLQHWSVQPCVRPVSAAHVTAAAANPSCGKCISDIAVTSCHKPTLTHLSAIAGTTLGAHFVMIGRGSALQASVAERPIALPPATQGSALSRNHSLLSLSLLDRLTISRRCDGY